MSRRHKQHKSFERDYCFYLDRINAFVVSGTNVKYDYGIQSSEDDRPELDEDGNEIPFTIPYSPAGKTAKKCFYELDSTGRTSACSEPDLLIKLLNCKAAVNLQIKIWAQSRAEYTLSEIELIEYCKDLNCPEWVFVAVEKSKNKLLQQLVEKNPKSPYDVETLTLHLSEIIPKIR